LYVARWLNG